ncbi:hypothetical protein ACJIZ3_013733 [Penstemon smallii]|uniref:CREG-like beta-barrel domain-containing protein n=1 Tax=Penstemon smallii TaxID=265156 RepID=A0ABD3RHH0_9LAMI
MSYILMMIIMLSGVAGLDRPRPDPNQAAAFARWLISEIDWCVLTTINPNGDPFGNVVSYTDVATGVPFFYLTTTLDSTGKYAITNPLAAFTISEKVLGTCGTRDPQSPVCSKLSLTGKLMLIQGNTSEGAFGESALFQAHPQLSVWPKRIKAFDVFKLVHTEIFLVNDFLPPKNLTIKEYLSYKYV